MPVTRLVAAIVLFLNLPIPLYWFVLHPFGRFWRMRLKAAYVTALLCSWLPVTAALVACRHQMFRHDPPPLAAITAGVALIVIEIWIFWRVRRDLGASRLVGHTELKGGGELQLQGIYARMRHPRYVGSLLAIIGACLLAGTRLTWIVSAVWAVLMLVSILLEEREMHARFGAAYVEYCRRVPMFLPLFRRAAE
ncbi:MAG TPA: isoprenylcysteine carboxylmethyltransferase family protein [Candidatus Dormibacteraeota bacterium]|nr:isoprenylcysteine carboxylmethyltransferase family protein [Candidatus Dormibacteraeota bacterium]